MKRLFGLTVAFALSPSPVAGRVTVRAARAIAVSTGIADAFAVLCPDPS
jgi:hypothetical protein